VDNQIYYHNSDKFPAIASDYSEAKTRAEKITNQPQTTSQDSVFVYALESLPPVRRIASLPDKIQNNDYIPALGLASLALINFPEDVRDIKSAGEQINTFLKGGKYQGSYDYKNFQHDFSFFRGTMLERFVDLKQSKNKKLAKKLLSWDKSLLQTNFGSKINNLLKVEASDFAEVKTFNKEKGVWEIAKDINGKARFATTFEGSAFAKLTARAMSRTTLIGTAVLAVIELPKIFKAMGEGDNITEQAGNTVKQTVKSGINLVSITAGIAYGGAIGSKYGKAVGSLVGMGAGAVLGSLTFKKVQEFI